MGLTFPRYGHRLVTPTLISRDQVQERFTVDQKDRLGGFNLREIGAAYTKSPRAVPGQGYVEGAIFESGLVPLNVFRPEGINPT